MSEAKVETAIVTQEQPRVNAAALVPMGEKGVMLRSLDDLLRFGKLAVLAGVAPRGMSEGGAAMAIQAGLERGLGPLGGLQHCVVINGVLSWRGQGAAALIQNSPACKPGTYRAWTEGEGDEMKGIAVAHRTGYATPDRREFSVKDAKTAGLWGKEGPWRTYPKRQLMWRAVGFLARDVFADVLGGFPIAEEAMDFEVHDAPPADRTTIMPPAQPDPLLAALDAPVDAVPVAPSSAEEPGAEDAAQAFSDAVPDPAAEPPAPGCDHPNCPPSRVADATARGKSITCLHCGEQLSAEPPPPDLELSPPQEPKRRSSKLVR